MFLTSYAVETSTNYVNKSLGNASILQASVSILLQLKRRAFILQDWEPEKNWNKLVAKEKPLQPNFMGGAIK